MFGLILYIVVIFVVIASTLFLIKKTLKQRNSNYSQEPPQKQVGNINYNPKQFMTDTERQFYGKLQSAVQGYFVFPQVSTSSIITPFVSPYNYGTYKSALNKINQTTIDYIICDSSLNIVALIELDDKSHDKKQDRDQKRDSYTAQAGYRTIRFDCRSQLTAELIRQRIFAP